MLDVIFSFFAPFLKCASPIVRWWPWRVPVLLCRRALLVALLVQDEEIDAAVNDVLVCSIFGCDSRHLAQIPNLRHAEQSTYSKFELYNINKMILKMFVPETLCWKGQHHWVRDVFDGRTPELWKPEHRTRVHSWRKEASTPKEQCALRARIKRKRGKQLLNAPTCLRSRTHNVYAHNSTQYTRTRKPCHTLTISCGD